MKKEFLTRLSVCVSLSFSLLFWCLDFLIFFFILPQHRKIQHFSTHTQEKRKEKKRRETTFLIRLFTRTSSYTHRRHLKHIKERERDYSFVVLVPHTLFRLFLFSLSLSSFEKKAWRTRRNVRRSWKPGERN